VCNRFLTVVCRDRGVTRKCHIYNGQDRSSIGALSANHQVQAVRLCCSELVPVEHYSSGKGEKMKKVLGLFLTLIMIFGLSQVAHATVDQALALSDGTNIIEINSSGVVTVLAGTASTLFSSGSGGTITWDGSLGNYNVNVSTGQGSPTLPDVTLDLNSADTASGSTSGILGIFFSQNGNTVTPPGWSLTFGGTLSSGSGSSVSLSAYGSTADTFFGSTSSIASLGPFGPGAFSGTASGSGAGLTTTPYSLTEEVDINGVGNTRYSGDASLNPVPEPASLTMVGTGLIGLAGLLRRKLVGA